MRCVRTILVAFAVVTLAACGPAQKGPLEGAPLIDVDDARESLTLPPDTDTAPTLKQLEAAAGTGHVRAAWIQAHYLIDLFDAARFEPDLELRDKARNLLFATLDIAPGSGPATTDLVLDALLVKADRLLEADRLHAGGQAARTLLEFDRKRPARADLFARTVALKAIARGDGPLRANAMLRLADFCRSAFRDAVRAPTPFRPGILGYCLYPLFDSDPEPYFAHDPAQRPPEPAWQDLAGGVRVLLGEMGDTKSRIAGLGAALATDDLQFMKAKQQLLPTHPTPSELGAPMLARAEPYEWTPLVRLGDGQTPPAADLGAKLAPVVGADRRGRVAVALSASAPATTVLTAAAAARSAGADTLELIVGYEQLVKAPSGDYWHKRAKDDKVPRLGVLPFALDPSAQSGEGGRGGPRASDWDPARAALGLHLAVSAGTWRLSAASGAFPEIPAGAGKDPAAGLRAQLALVRSAFPDEDGLVIVPEAGASYAQLLAAADAARHDAAGKPLFRALALAGKRPAVNAKGDLAARTARRAAATVTLVPDALAGRAPALRQCYQDALDRAPRLAGVVALELKQPVKDVPPAAQVMSGPADKPLRACLAQSLSPAMVAGGIQTVRVTLSPK